MLIPKKICRSNDIVVIEGVGSREGLYECGLNASVGAIVRATRVADGEGTEGIDRCVYYTHTAVVRTSPAEENV